MDLQRRGFPVVHLMNCTIKSSLKALAGEGGVFIFLSLQMSSPAPFPKAENSD